MASIRVQYVGNEDGKAVVKYGNMFYYCRVEAFETSSLVSGQWYNIDHSELRVRA
jgi:hypothetical protein